MTGLRPNRNGSTMSQTDSAQILSGRMTWLDGLRLLAGVSMVGLHASSDPNGQPFPDFEAAERVFPVLFRAIIYTARTELFLIISLFLLCMSLDRRPRGYLPTILEQARRLLLPFAFWVAFYAFYRLIKAGYFGYEDAIWRDLGAIWQWARYLILGSVQYHMHFLPTLFGLVLLYPLYLFAVGNPWLGVLVIVCLFAKREADVLLWSQMQDWPGFPYYVRAVKIMTYAGYGLVAASAYGVLQRGVDRSVLNAILVAALVSGIALFLIKLVYSYKVIQTGVWQYNYTPAYWADFLFPALLFVGAMAAGLWRWPDIISKLAPYSFGIYLVHPAFLDLMEIALWGATLAPWVFVLGKFVPAVVLTWGAVWLLSKSSLLGWTVGLRPLPIPNLSLPARKSVRHHS